MAKFHAAHAGSTVLVVDSDALMLTAIGGVLDMQGYKAVLARTEQVAAQALQGQAIDLIILSIDQLEPGCAFAARLRGNEATHEIPIIFIVPALASDWTGPLQQHGGVYCVARSVDPHDFVDLVDKALWMPHLAQRRASPPQPHLGKTHADKSNANKSSDWVKLD
ncbi:MAG: hypothetical protein ACTHK7_11205 [Aureliella sp.]